VIKAVSILNVVVFKEEASLVQQYVARVWTGLLMRTAAFLYKMQAHIAISVVLPFAGSYAGSAEFPCHSPDGRQHLVCSIGYFCPVGEEVAVLYCGAKNASTETSTC
jgi:hypothetical protein